MYVLCNSFAIGLINGMDIWHEVDADDLHSSLYKKGSVRPKKLIFMGLCEGGSRLRRVGMTYKCTKCDKMGHNSRRCKETTQNLDALKIKIIFHFDMLLSYIGVLN